MTGRIVHPGNRFTRLVGPRILFLEISAYLFIIVSVLAMYYDFSSSQTSDKPTSWATTVGQIAPSIAVALLSLGVLAIEKSRQVGNLEVVENSLKFKPSGEGLSFQLSLANVGTMATAILRVDVEIKDNPWPFVWRSFKASRPLQMEPALRRLGTIEPGHIVEVTCVARELKLGNSRKARLIFEPVLGQPLVYSVGGWAAIVREALSRNVPVVGSHPRGMLGPRIAEED